MLINFLSRFIGTLVGREAPNPPTQAPDVGAELPWVDAAKKIQRLLDGWDSAQPITPEARNQPNHEAENDK